VVTGKELARRAPELSGLAPFPEGRLQDATPNFQNWVREAARPEGSGSSTRRWGIPSHGDVTADPSDRAADIRNPGWKLGVASCSRPLERCQAGEFGSAAGEFLAGDHVPEMEPVVIAPIVQARAVRLNAMDRYRNRCRQSAVRPEYCAMAGRWPPPKGGSPNPCRPMQGCVRRANRLVISPAALVIAQTNCCALWRRSRCGTVWSPSQSRESALRCVTPLRPRMIDAPPRGGRSPHRSARPRVESLPALPTAATRCRRPRTRLCSVRSRATRLDGWGAVHELATRGVPIETWCPMPAWPRAAVAAERGCPEHVAIALSANGLPSQSPRPK